MPDVSAVDDRDDTRLVLVEHPRNFLPLLEYRTNSPILPKIGSDDGFDSALIVAAMMMTVPD